MARKYISLGCSLTEQPGYVNHFNQTYNLDILNLAVSAGSNQLQSVRLKNCIFNNEIDQDTTLVWQITAPRSHAVGDKKETVPMCTGEPFVGMYDWIPQAFDLFDKTEVALLSNNDYFRPGIKPNPAEIYQNLTADIYQWSFIVKEIIVYLGWSIFVDEIVQNKMYNFLKTRPNIKVIPRNQSIIDWCKHHNLKFFDQFHPSTSSYVAWGDQILLPYLGL